MNTGCVVSLGAGGVVSQGTHRGCVSLGAHRGCGKPRCTQGVW